MPELSMPSRSSVVWNSDVVTTCVRPSPRSSKVAVSIDDVARHAVPLEGLHDALLRRHLAEAALEAVDIALVAVLDEPPVAAALDLHALDVELVAAAPPLRDQLGSVSARHTRSRGASKTRSMRISRGAGVVTCSEPDGSGSAFSVVCS